MAMEMNIGEVSGCLEVIGDCTESEMDLQETIYQWAEEEWNRFENWYSTYDLKNEGFKSYYRLNKTESKLYVEKGTMPQSFVTKFRKKGHYRNICHDKRFLWHERQPNTANALVEGYKNKKIYKVKCNICNRIFYMDSQSFGCVKWKSCIGAECLANTVDEQGIDYSKSLYEWNQNKNELQVLNSQLAKVEELSNPLTYYSAGTPYNTLKIAYISDIHLHHHLKYYNNNAKRMIRDVSDKLYQSKGSVDIILFGGDISETPEMTMMFFTQFKRKYDYDAFKRFKNELYRLKRLKKEMSIGSKSKHVKCLDNISKYIEKRKEDLKSSFDFSVFEKYKEKYHPCIVYEAAYENFKKTKSFKKCKVSEQTEVQILETLRLLNIQRGYGYEIETYERTQKNRQFVIEKFEKKYSKPVEDILLNDYRHILLEDVYFVLGNHEYIEFADVQTCEDFYEEKLSELGITLLNNEYVENDDFLIYGGTGFAKYEDEWNANRIVCCSNFTREDEIRETTLFEVGYKVALDYAKEKGLCFLCLSHYPVSACLNNAFDKEVIYFTGHNHRNEFVKITDKVLYADNQIGYENNNIFFKRATTGFELNPYSVLNDGLYKTTINDYLQFYRYIGEHVGEGKLLYQRCQNGRANLYVVKRKGYYGFFVIASKGDSKGTSIVNGGVTKKITSSTDMAWICENFDVVLSKYFQMLLPLRKAQEELSKELTELGLDGTIHGLIVDIDFYHHISINPTEGSMTFYYSSVFGSAMKLNSFGEVIKSLEYHKTAFSRYDCKLIQAKYDEKSKNKGYLLGILSNESLLETETEEINEISDRMEQIVSRREGMYGVSRKINPLQRLFSGHVLRDFDLRLTETKQQSYRKYLYTNRVFIYEGVMYQVIEDDGSDVIVAEEIQEDSRSEGNAIKRSGNTRKFAITALKSKIANQNEWGTCWIS